MHPDSELWKISFMLSVCHNKIEFKNYFDFNNNNQIYNWNKLVMSENWKLISTN